MPTVGYYSNPSSITLAMTPKTSWGTYRASLDRNLQLGAVMEQRAQLQRAQQQQEIAKYQQTVAQMNSLPVEGPDQRRIKQWVLNRESETRSKIENEYNGDVEKYIAVEGEVDRQRAVADLLGSDVYQIAQRNKEQIALAKAAINDKNKNLVGSLTPDGRYRNAENDLVDYYKGVAPTYTFNGSYDAKTNVMDHFAKLDNPNGKYDRESYVAPDQILNYLQQEKGAKEGLDLYYRQFNGRNIPYKQYSPEDEQLFNLDILNKQSAIDERGARINKLNTDAAKKSADNEDNIPSIERSLTNPIGNSAIYPYQDDPSKVIPTLGIPASSLVSTAEDGSKGIVFTRHPAQVYGSAFVNAAGLTGKNSKVQDLFLPDNGGHNIDLRNINHSIISVDATSYYLDGNAEKQATLSGGKTRPDRTWAKVSVKIPEEDAMKAGLLNDTIGPWNTVTQKGANLRRDSEGNFIIEGYVPVQGFLQNKQTDILGTKALQGQKESNATNFDDWSTKFDEN